jgi:predicted Rossmann fold nucleotide-binding protein DprA/Smf involved in DNA uptake
MSEFKQFLLNESVEYLAQKIGDVVTAIQSLEEDSKSLGNRQLLRSSDVIVSQIRQILSGKWSQQELKYLKELQKCGVAMAKAIEGKEDMVQVLSEIRASIESLVSKMNRPINTLASDQPPPSSTDSSS